jgi:uncharacterized protein (TIGR02246 family)
MKKSIQFSLLLAFFSIAAFITPVNAQDATTELAAFTKQYQDAFNKKDIKALKRMFTKDAVRTGTDGKANNGVDSIASVLDATMKNDVTVSIQQEKVVTENGITVATGTYHLTGTSTSGEKIDRRGAYTNTLVKDGGQWKVTKQVLTNL